MLSEKVRILIFGCHKDAATLGALLTKDSFDGVLVSDDAAVYRGFSKSQKCWAHLIRKAIRLTLFEPDNTEYRRFLDGLLAVYRNACRFAVDKRLGESGRLLNATGLATFLSARNPVPLPVPPTKFSMLKQLAGKWEGISHSPEGKKKSAVEYQLTSAGTVLLEKLNQPRMKLAKGDKPNVYKFVYLDGTSMKSEKDPHMHQLTMTFSGKDKLTHEWVFFAGGKKQFTVRMELQRKK